MGWISARKMKTGCALYTGGPKRKGPLRKIVRFTSYDLELFGHHTAWLECGHYISPVYGEVRAICHKCKDGKPKDIEDPKTERPVYNKGGVKDEPKK